MYPRKFDYVRATSWEDALQHLADAGEAARPLAGGQSLVPLLKLRLVAPTLLVDIGHLPKGTVRADRHRVYIPALSRHAELERDPILGTMYPLIRDMIPEIGDAQVRHMGTIGGSIAHADPASDWAAALLALRAEVLCESVRGQRSIPIRRFFVGPYTTALEPGELLKEISIQLPTASGNGLRTGGAYLKAKRRAGSFAIAAVAVQLSVDDGGCCRSVGIGLCGLGFKPEAAEEVEQMLTGRYLDDTALQAAGQRFEQVVEACEDLRGSAEYKRALGRVLLERALRLAKARALGVEVVTDVA